MPHGGAGAVLGGPLVDIGRLPVSPGSHAEDAESTAAAASIYAAAKRAQATSFACMNKERPCPDVDFSKGAELNARVGSRCNSKHKECCHAITRSWKAADRAEALVDGNWYVKYCSFSPIPFEPVVEWVARWYIRVKKQSKNESSKRPPEMECSGECGRRCLGPEDFL
mmetsp:Transcript_155915/g.287387  ORF Transcript_155915/g.287387 Transcript_155915/m.287387 type:complete len:168 (-) Transcript_155915:51-554(-)